jgi:hypothetical protein
MLNDNAFIAEPHLPFIPVIGEIGQQRCVFYQHGFH